MKHKTLLLLGILILTAMIVYSATTLPHEFSNHECTICHNSSNQGSFSKNKTSGRRGRTKKKTNASVTSTCLTCHTNLFEEGYMHPVDITPKKVVIPLDFPLSKYGTLTCNTCHDVHAPYETPYGEPSHFLRRYETGKAFCDICHSLSNNSGKGHQVMFRKAHFDSRFTESDSDSGIDELSRSCISCHDGSFATSVPVNLRAGSWRHTKNYLKFDQGFKHPIGMQYSTVRLKNPKSSLKKIGDVDKRLHFFNGKIGCGTCHDPFSSKNNKLVIPVNNEQLCLSCHNF